MSSAPDPSSNPYAPSAAEQPEPAEAQPIPAKLDDEVRTLFQRGRNGAHWFYWVAGLSAINSIAAVGGANFGFALGLGATLIVDSVAAAIAKEQGTWIPTAVAVVFDVVVLGLVVLSGWLSSKRFLIVFGLGMFLYLLDGLIFLLLGDIVSIAIHAFALWGMWSGFSAYRRLNAIEHQLAAGPAIAG